MALKPEFRLLLDIAHLVDYMTLFALFAGRAVAAGIQLW
jgi:hypothetical protein